MKFYDQTIFRRKRFSLSAILLSLFLNACGKSSLPDPVWDGQSASYCRLRARDIRNSPHGIHIRRNSDSVSAGIHPDQWITQGRLQEAIWELEETGIQENESRASELKRQLSELLRNHPYTVLNQPLSGSCRKKVLIFENGIWGLYKERGDWNSPSAEVAAYQLDQAIGLHFVPLTLLREIDGQVGSVQIFMTNVREGTPQDISAQDFSTLKILDYLTGNWDRLAFNFLYQFHSQRVLAIDNGAAFSGTDCGSLETISEFLELDPTLAEKLARIRPEAVRLRLRHYLDSEALNRVMTRIGLLSEVAQRQIQE